MAIDWNYGKHIKRNNSFKRNMNLDDSDIRLLEQRPSKTTSLRPSRSFNEIFAMRNCEYLSEYNARIPKAAGFQKFTKDGVDELVHRMYDKRVKKHQKPTGEKGSPQQAVAANEFWVPPPSETLRRTVRVKSPKDDEPLSTLMRVQTPRCGDTLYQSRRMQTSEGKEKSRPYSRIRQTTSIDAPSEKGQESTGTETTSFNGRRKLTAHEDRIIGECLNQPTVTSLIRKMLRTLSPVDVKNVSLYCRQCRLPISQRKTRSPYYNFFLDETERLYFMKKRN